MLNKLILKNFKQHEDLEIAFTEGFNAIRGANEAGKTSIFHAIRYAFFGSRALELSLEETVTWGKPVGSLRVDLFFTLDGVLYHIYRTKSSAEMTGNGHTYSGQDGVTDKIAELLKLDAKTASQVLMASQNEVRTAIETGSGALIERLSGMDLIDRLIQKATTHLEVGSTKDKDARIAAIEEDLMQPEPVDESKPLEAVVETLTTQVAADKEAFAANATWLAVNELAVNAIKSKQRDVESATRQAAIVRDRIATWESLVVETQARIEVHVDVDALVSAQAGEGDRAAVQANLVHFNAMTKEFLPPEGNTAERDAATARLNETLLDLYRTIAENTSEIQHCEQHLASKGVCPTCGTALEDLDELAKLKAATKVKLDSLVESKAKASGSLVEIKTQLDAIKNLEIQNQKLAAKMAPFPAEFVKADTSVWPVQYTWIGPTSFNLSGRDWTAEIKAARTFNSDMDKLAVKLEMAKESLEGARQNLKDLEAEIVEVDTSLLVQYEEVRSKSRELQLTLDISRQKLGEATTNLAQARMKYTHAMEIRQLAVSELERLRTQVASMVLNNGIVKKLRDARGVVTARLWNLILALVSQEFSNIRGVQSVVTRNPKGFLIDGKPYAAFSGSTIDSLALAIRPSLQRIFLGGVDFMLLDEPAAAMDENRELNLLGQVSRTGIPQSLVITHSELADTFASNVIQI